MLSYRTEYPNQVHLLAVSVSKHWWIAKDGTLKYQKKPFEVTLRNLPNSGKAHCVVFGLRDHCSGILYCDLASSENLPPLAEFLYRAWAPKSNLSFRGMPELLGVPKTVQAAFPGITDAVESLGVSLVPITSGFQGGAGMTKPVEQWIAFDLGKPFEGALARVAQLPAILASEKGRTGDRSKLDMWQHGVPDRLLDGPPMDWLDTARDQTRIVLAASGTA
jgi:hypothetical protein